MLTYKLISTKVEPQVSDVAVDISVKLVPFAEQKQEADAEATRRRIAVNRGLKGRRSFHFDFLIHLETPPVAQADPTIRSLATKPIQLVQRNAASVNNIVRLAR